MDFFELCCNYNNYTDKYMELNFNSHNNQNNNRENKIKNNNINKKINNKNINNLSIDINLKKDNNKEIFGLINIGSTCYMNSFLQILFHCDIFLNEIKKFENNNYNKVILKNFIKLIKNPYSKKNLYEFKSSLKNISIDYSKYIQNDSQKFGIDLINELISEIKNEKYFTIESEKDTNNTTIIDPKKNYEYFLEKYQNNLINLEKMFIINEYRIYEKNYKKKIEFENFININLYFPEKNKNNYFIQKYNLKELLDFKYKNNNKYKVIKICNFPEILIISINRAVIEKTIKYYSINLEYPEILKLGDYADKNITESEKIEYSLFGVNKKIGFTENYGHYYCEIKIKNIWYKLDDLNVTSSIDFNNISDEVVGLFYVKNKI